MLDMKAKQEILEEIMQMMDEHMAEGLKSKSPKFMKPEAEAEKPEDEMPSTDEEKPSMEMASEDEDDEERLKRLYEDLA
jgi:hypothetical protein